MPFGIKEVVSKQSVKYVDSGGIIREGIEVVIKEGHITSPDKYTSVLVCEHCDPDDLKIDTSCMDRDGVVKISQKGLWGTTYYNID